MPSNIFINDLELQLTQELVKLLTNEGQTLYSTHAPDSDEKTAGTAVSTFRWEKSSPVSARSLMVNILRKTKNLDRAFLIFRPSGSNEAFHTLSTSKIDMELDSSMRGLVYLTKNILSQYIKQGSGALTFVIHLDGALIQTPLCAAMMGAYREFVNSIFIQYEKQNIELSGFFSDNSKTEGFASYIVDTLQSKPSKFVSRWNSFSKKGFFSK